MKKLLLMALVAVVLLGALMLSVGDLGSSRVSMRGDGPRASPRAPPEEQGIAREAVDEALARAVALRSGALIVHRRGHRIAEHFGEGTTEESLVAGGDLARLLPALAAGVLVEEGRVGTDEALAAIDRLGSGEPFLPDALQPDPAQFLSQRVWQPLGAGEAWLQGSPDGDARLDCCIVARLGDWMRLSDLLLAQGEREGERVVRPQWVRELMSAPEPGAAPRLRWLAAPAGFGGDEPPAARDAVAVDLAPDIRLWLVPSRQLAVLHKAADPEAARDTAIPNMLIRGIVDSRPPAIHEGGEAAIGDMVPRH
jgi:CubicO group peptidase (beta-lactamase class C family)